MGSCASKPKEADPEVLPQENPASSEQALPKTGDGSDPTIENKKNVGTKEPLVDLSEPKPDAPSSNGKPKANTDLVSQIGVSNPALGDSGRFSEADLEAVDLD
ncbi:hypothetical protein CKAN_01856400 [Cinnamomum micranthum f. kanehirae]|uniref:Uncharacterized protein n=1 Tax=Cinnamomum micranthum f. kanehirae TaxID=337451 RepID=A0A3S3PFF5_9MAGN|nr:hypothetical protein CKAN_01856400 [Cinnamomum micranthum f. kanehirae]